MSGIIDTNILLYAANVDAPEHTRARTFLEEAVSEPGLWYLTEGICYEFFRVSTHTRVFPQPLGAIQAFAFLEALLTTERFEVLSASRDHWKWLREVLNHVGHPAGNLFFDIRTVVLMREHGIRQIYTADTDFLQFDEIAVHNPFSSRYRQ
ncbi:MAG: TA system VapC family ribonuclease toxin [Opitutales bacterium]